MDQYQHVGTGVAVVTGLGSLAGWLPPLAAGFTIIWMVMQIVINWDKFINAIAERIDRWFK